MHEHRLKRQLGLIQAVMIGVSLDIGIFALVFAYLLNAGTITVETLFPSQEMIILILYSILTLGAILVFLGILSIAKK